MQRVIEIPSGTRFVLAAQIPGWIAERLVPVPDTPPVLVSLQKKIPQPEYFQMEALTEADVLLLEEIWRGMPAPSPLELIQWHSAKESLTREDFAPYKEAFDAAPNKPAWYLHADFLDVKEEAKKQRSEVREAHWDELEARARAGRLRILTSYGIPTEEIAVGSMVSVEDARNYLSQVPPGFELRGVPPVQIATQVIDIPAGSAFVKAADIANWIAEALEPIREELHADYQDAEHEAKLRQANVRHEHFWALNNAVKEREINLFSAERTPIYRMDPGALLRVEDARRYLEPRGFELREVSVQQRADATALVDADAPSADSERKPLPRQRYQEDEILREIRNLGHDPKALPNREAGKPWIKSEVRAKFPQFTDSVFDKAWERLRRAGDIGE
jgi:hypothetical protein